MVIVVGRETDDGLLSSGRRWRQVAFCYLRVLKREHTRCCLGAISHDWTDDAWVVGDGFRNAVDVRDRSPD